MQCCKMAAILTSLGHSVSGFSAWLQIICVFPGSSVNPFQSVIWCQSPRLCTHPLFCMSHMWNSTVVIHYWKKSLLIPNDNPKINTSYILHVTHETFVIIMYKNLLNMKYYCRNPLFKKYKHCWFQVHNPKINEISQILLSLMWPLLTT